MYSIFLIVNAYLFIENITLEKYFNNEITDCKTENKRHNDAFLRDMELLFQELNIDSILVCDIMAQRTSPLLIFAFTKDECNKCIVADISLLKNEISLISEENVIILPVFENSRNTNIYLKADLDGLKYKRLDKGYIKFPQRIDGSSVRFFAILTKQNKVVLPFFPSNEYPERTKTYLNFVFNKIL